MKIILAQEIETENTQWAGDLLRTMGSTVSTTVHSFQIIILIFQLVNPIFHVV